MKTIKRAPTLKVVETKTIQTIDCTPTWSGILPALIAVLEDGNATGRKIAREELARMAQLADRYVAAQKTA